MPLKALIEAYLGEPIKSFLSINIELRPFLSKNLETPKSIKYIYLELLSFPIKKFSGFISL